jgi:hypothetical protein
MRHATSSKDRNSIRWARNTTGDLWTTLTETSPTPPRNCVCTESLTFNGILLTKHVCLPNSSAFSHSRSRSHISPIMTPVPSVSTIPLTQNHTSKTNETEKKE